MDWTGWHEVDQFGWHQPSLAQLVGPSGRSKLSGVERPYNYQVSISFPGADFDKGSGGQYAALSDHTGKHLASSGTEMAEAIQSWLTEGWLDGDEMRGLDHIFVCSKNLKFCEGSIKAKNFRIGQPKKESREADGGVAILNENWAMYLRESFLEASVVIFVINEDWLDSIPCNQEFEALITRKRQLQGAQKKNAIIFVDITNEKFNQRWGGKLPQFKEGLTYEAGKYFDVFNYTYNVQANSEQKLYVQQDLIRVVAEYSTKFPAVPGKVYNDLMPDAKIVNWPNWLFFRSLEGTNGWEPLLEEYQEGDGCFDNKEPLIWNVPKPFSSRRFRLRLMGVAGDTFQEGFKFMCRAPLLIDASTGQNIVAEGKGFWKTPGERNPGLRPLGFSHWVGPKQYSWLEWLIPDNEPPALVSSADIRVNARYWVLEALPASVWPCNGNILRDGYNFLGFDDPNATAAKDKAIREPRWQALHSMAEASCLSEDCTYTLPASTPACKAFRLRLLEASEPGSDHLAAGLQLKAGFPEGMYPISGGQVTGSGGNAELEDAPPAYAFDGDEQNRWVDINGGGIGNISWLAYEHTEPVMVMEYTITSQMYALSSYHSHLNGAPRDWTLKACKENGDWEEIDRQTHIYFSGHRQTQKFVVAKPIIAQKYMLEFTAVAAGCASRSIQVGDVELLAKLPARNSPLQQSQLVVLASACNSVSPATACATPCGSPAADYGIHWPDPDLLQVLLPAHLGYGTGPPLGVLRGGRLGWVLGQDRVTNWYDHPLDITLEPRMQEDADAPVVTTNMLVVRPRKDVIIADKVHQVTFRPAYPARECELQYTHTRPVTIKAYGMRSCPNYNRGDPRTWVLEAETAPGIWEEIHHVTNYHFADRGAPVLFHLPDNAAMASKYRLVILEMKAMVGLLHLGDFVLYASMEHQEAADDLVQMHYREAAHVTMKVKMREGQSGLVKLSSYMVCPLSSYKLEKAFPKAWVLEGLTSEY
eukprot:CAMPEP_0202355414 /NCGR_PEP_ID=MMETSP1126-20121109/10320_1 /ASSEMBLY_ACC=CAM_ASM_000457 /TAXON_ID=3047 /ORGANISM="Dunaliella tertiolecta, Strain CCMP1320" /LENGTH=984 /DNA_ID=CAMNT_0048948029 /DNA_START=163 /DNA_END=3117 /DNA_ORIENTATION=-